MKVYRLPHRIRNSPKMMDEFKEWCVDQDYDVSLGRLFSVRKPNGSLGETFKNGYCNKEFLLIARNFLISEKKIKVIGCTK